MRKIQATAMAAGNKTVATEECSSAMTTMMLRAAKMPKKVNDSE
jgi:hypothetical protein